MKRFIAVYLLILLTLSSSALAEFEVRFLDVGQADAALVICDGQVLMIDGGNGDDSQFIYSYLKNTLGIQYIDFMVSTHPHEDHIGGLAAALNACRIGTVLSPVTVYDSVPFEDFLKYVHRQYIEITQPDQGYSFSLGTAMVTVISDLHEEFGSNDKSIILRIDYGSTSFLFTGDAEWAAENAALESGINLTATVLKVGHHGSDTSTSEPFLAAVSPQYAVISVGANNDYGLPSDLTLNRLKAAGITIYRTDLYGTIACTSDGEKVTFTAEKSPRRR